MKLNLIAGHNNELLMTHEDGIRPFPVVIVTFAGNKEVVSIAQELMKMYNNQQEQLLNDNVVRFQQKGAKLNED